MPQFEFNDALYSLTVTEWGDSLGAVVSALRQHLVLAPRDALELIKKKNIVVAIGLRLELLELQKSLQKAGVNASLIFEAHPEKVHGTYKLIHGS